MLFHVQTSEHFTKVIDGTYNRKVESKDNEKKKGGGGTKPIQTFCYNFFFSMFKSDSNMFCLLYYRFL